MPRATNVSLTLVTLRLRTQDIDRARAVANETATPYSHVIRAWVADGARRAKEKKRG